MSGNREPKYKKSSAKQSAEIYNALNEHGKVVVESDGFKRYCYDAGWSDEAITKFVGSPPSSVTSVRRRDFGDLLRQGEWKLPKGPKRSPAVYAADQPTREDYEALQQKLHQLSEVVSRQGVRLAGITSWVVRNFGEGELQ